MRQSPSVSSAVVARAAAAAAQAVRLREYARSLRRLSGSVRYNPLTGERPTLTPELDDCLAVIEQVLNEIQQGAGERGDDESALAASGDAAARHIRSGHEAIARAVQGTGAVIAVLRGTLSTPDDAHLDAPYGHGSPKRHHPGALCTIVAARAEALADALESVAIARLNLIGTR
ncbi:MAG: hypothetical protein ACT4PY_08965 [Armatimonadota bacterium]